MSDILPYTSRLMIPVSGMKAEPEGWLLRSGNAVLDRSSNSPAPAALRTQERQGDRSGTATDHQSAATVKAVTRRPSEVDGVEVRIVLPRDAIPSAPRPEYFSQKNCDLLGLTTRGFLELLRRPDAPAVTHVGKQRLVRRDAMLAFLDRLAAARPRTPKLPKLDEADRLLVELGCTPGSPRGAE